MTLIKLIKNVAQKNGGTAHFRCTVWSAGGCVIKLAHGL